MEYSNDFDTSQVIIISHFLLDSKTNLCPIKS